MAGNYFPAAMCDSIPEFLDLSAAASGQHCEVWRFCF
jgi:hypothetical protein